MINSRVALLILLASVLGLNSNLPRAYSLDSSSVFSEGVPKLDGNVVTLPSFSDLASVVGPAVVYIAVEGADRDALEVGGTSPGQFKRENPVASLGSGFIISRDGYIVTNNHVIEKAGKITVRLLDDKTEYPAQLVGRDQKTDIALLKIEASSDIAPVLLGDSDDVNVGDWVLAIGNQFQLGQTVTAGIVSAKSRKVPMGGPYDDFIQTDASINPGSSGGPLFNTKGQVVGINTAIFSPGPRNPFSGSSGFNIGIGFATPINIAKSIINQLKSDGKVTRGWLGVLIQPVTPDVAFVFGLKSYYGALVGHVIAGSPAEKAGLKRGDVIVKFNEELVKENDSLPLLVANTPIGKAVAVELVRDGKEVTKKVTIELLKDESPVEDKKDDVQTDALGLVVEDVSEKSAHDLELKKGVGAQVELVAQRSVAEAAGILAGDVIEAIRFKGRPELTVSGAAQFAKLVATLVPGEPVMFTIRRRDRKNLAGIGVSSLYLIVKPS